MNERLFFLGPGLVLAVEVSGETGLTELLAAGAVYGYGLLGFIVLTLIFKYAFTSGIARYTISEGRTIFDGLREIPGPKNWEVIFIMFIYLMETIAFGGVALVAATMLTHLVPALPSRELIAIAGIGVIVFLLWRESYERFEHILTVMGLMFIVGVLYSLFAVPLPATADILHGFSAVAEAESLITFMALMGAVGSGLNLLLYSVWLHEKIGDRHGEAYFRAHMRSVNENLVMVFVIVGIFAFGFIMLGYAALHGHGSDHMSLEAVVGDVAHVVDALPGGAAVFLITGFFTLFGATMSGMDGRARAIASILRSTTGTGRSEKTLYRAILLLFAAIMLSAVLFGHPADVIHHVAAAASIMFAVLGFMVIYLDSRLPAHARGSRLWLAVMVLGSTLFLAVALLQEEMFLTFGLPLIERFAVLGLVVYFLLRTNLIQRAIAGYLTPLDTVAVVTIFSLFSIYGTAYGIPFNDAIINFRDLGPMIAGLLGGPVAGLLTGLIGGAYRYSLGGWTAFPCFAATVAAGLIAGCFSRRWGAFTYLRFIFLGILVESVHLLIIFPLLAYPAPLADIIDLVRTVFLPMVVTNTLGLFFFLFMIRNQDAAGPVRTLDPAGFVVRAYQRIRHGGLAPDEMGGLFVLVVLAALLPAAFVLDTSLLASVLPLIERIAVLGFVAFLIAQTGFFRRLALGRQSTTDLLWLVISAGFLSVYGSMRGFEVAGLAVTFRDLGPMIAGLIGGPAAGLLAGLFGGAFSSSGGWPAFSSVVSPVVAGLLAGYFNRRWMGQFGFLRLIFLGALVACIQVLLLIPVSGLPEAPVTVLLPLIAANAVGLSVFLSMLRERGIETVLKERPYREPQLGVPPGVLHEERQEN
ncbi:Nramp family divalent metal transporter [Methanoculleus taiwanensis]|uniref:Nramp family divalent metal transporter n=1 Tax=Methanoculleus taiwanensis TaxID=1550565 RepID=UPI000FFEEEBD|nr:Nramp family divalent metal transporter [Methanoculleus taiwanensis]